MVALIVGEGADPQFVKELRAYLHRRKDPHMTSCRVDVGNGYYHITCGYIIKDAFYGALVCTLSEWNEGILEIRLDHTRDLMGAGRINNIPYRLANL